ncbi:MAG: TssN family type VI secretion system protein, partial [Bacteroidota bacterium]|nr:TssN family type VI secretion system protein [Bacteroidota bacterium]
VFSSNRFLPWIEKELHLYELLLTLIILFIVSGLQIIVFKRFSFIEESYIVYFIPAFIFFIVPTLAIKSFVFLIKIPEPVIKHKTWTYPINDEIDAPSHEMPDVIPINIAVKKSIDDTNITVVRANAPTKMKLGDFFYFVLQDYNLKNAGDPIYFANPNDEVYKWYFNIAPNWYETTRYIDPNLSIEDNKIKENRKIVCTRLLSE